MKFVNPDKSFYLFNYVKDNFSSRRDLFECIRYELNCHVYYYGAHFRSPYEASPTVSRNWREIPLLAYSVLQAYSVLHASFGQTGRSTKGRILSSSYIDINKELLQMGYSVFTPPWSLGRETLTDWNLFRRARNIGFALRRSNFNDLINDRFMSELDKFRTDMEKYLSVKDIKAFIVPHDMSFFENITIDVCKNLGIPTFIFAHGGMPSIYNLIDDNRTDYLIVWGQKIMDSYVKMGWDRRKIFVAGHPVYNKIPAKLDFGTENILVITKSMNGGQFSDKVRLADRGNCILYLYSIQKVLQQLGVTHATFRPHPSENARWYQKFIDNAFYSPDTGSLRDSLQQVSLVIGPISTVFVESLYCGKNYVLYEPLVNGINLMNNELTPPVDGTDKRIPLATSEEQLAHILTSKVKVHLDVLPDYVKIPFDISFIQDLIRN